MTAKLCLFGEGSVGKTSLIRRYVENTFDDKYITTIGTRVSKRNISLQSEKENMEVTLMIWDIMGQKGYRELLQEAYFSGSSAAIGVCDITRRETFEALDDWLQTITKIAGSIPIILLGNKYDLIGYATVREERLAELARRYDALYAFTSAKTGGNVNEAFQAIAERIAKFTVTVLHRPQAEAIPPRNDVPPPPPP